MLGGMALRGTQSPDTFKALEHLRCVFMGQQMRESATGLVCRWLSLAWIAFLIYSPTLALAQAIPEDVEQLDRQATDLYAQGYLAEAIPLAEQALEIHERILGPDHADLAISLNNVAFLYHEGGEYAKAELNYQRALSIREKALGPRDPATADSLVRLASLYQDAGMSEKGTPLLQRALAIQEKALGPERPEVATTLNILAAGYHDTHAYAKAEPLYLRALSIRDKALGPDHEDTADTLQDLALLYQDIREYGKSEPLYLRALTIYEKAPSPDPYSMARCLHNLAKFYSLIGVYAKAEPLILRALTMREQALGPKHPDTLRSVFSLATLYKDTGEYAKAEPLYIRVLKGREEVLGPDHLGTAESLDGLGSLYELTQEFAKAEPLYLRALGIREKVLGPDDSDTAISLNYLAYLYQQTGAYAKAEPLYLRALAIREKTRGPDDQTTATAIGNLAQLYILTAAYQKAVPLLVRALAITEKVLGPDHTNTATCLNDLGVGYEYIGQYEKAESLFVRALAIREKVLGPDHPDTAKELTNLANLYHIVGAYAKAEPLLVRALAIYEKTRGPDHLETAACMDHLELLYQDSGAYAKAEPLLLRVLEIRERVLGPYHPETASGFNNLSLLYEETGAYAKAEPPLLRALAIAEKTLGSDHPDTATYLVNLAELYRLTGADARAEPLLLRALAIRESRLGSDHAETARSLTALAGLYRERGDNEKAEPLAARALSIREKTLGFDHPETAESLNMLAMVYEDTGAYTKAEPLFRRALAIEENTFGPNHPHTAVALEQLAYLAERTDRAYPKAEQLYRRALTIAEKTLGPDHPQTGSSYNNVGFVRWAEGEPSKASPMFARALQIQEINIAHLLQAGSEERRRLYLATLNHSAFVSYSLADPSPVALALGATAVLQLKGRLLDATADSAARLRHHLDSQGLRQLEELQGVVAQRANLSLAGPVSPGEQQRWQHQVAELSRTQEELEEELAKRSSDFAQAIQPVTLARVQRELNAGDVLVEWTRFTPVNPRKPPEERAPAETRYAAYLITRKAVPVVVDLGLAATIEQAIQRLLSRLSTPFGDIKPKESHDLFNLVMKPLMQTMIKLQGPSGRLFLSPDGALNLVPLAALLDDHGRFLGERYTLNYVTSGRDLLRLGSKEVVQPRQGIEVFAAPAYDEPGDETSLARTQPHPASVEERGEQRRSGFEALPGTATEAALLQRLLRLDPDQIATGTRASKAHIKSLTGPKILHIATHAFFLEDEPQVDISTSRGRHRGFESAGPSAFPAREDPLLRAGLALAGANLRSQDGEDNGILTAAEFAQLDLQGTQLVVLSACETGTGEISNGEGVYGLRRAVVLAGARSQLVSLWKVSDEATAQLMGEYYRRLKIGEGRAQALRSAQEVLRADPATAHPYYWATFISVGDWRPIATL